QTQDAKLKKILIDLGERVEGGESLSRAMQRHPRTFNNLFIGMIRAGEVGGVLEESLQRLSAFLESDVALRRKVKSALTYPVFVKLHHKVCMARFSRTMGTLLTSGVPILQAMETVAGTVGNSIMADAVLEARARIREGDRIGDPLEASRLFPPMVVHMIGVGEESGSLDYMLQKIADFYGNEVEATLASLPA